MRETDDGDLRARCREARGVIAAGVLASAAAAWYEYLAPDRRPPAGDDPSVSTPPRSAASGLPILAIGGRPTEAATGLLSAGSARQSARRLLTFTRYARSVCDVHPALAPIVTSASVTAEYKGTFTIDAFEPVVERYLEAAREVGASLLLQVQPGRASLAEIIERWTTWLAEPDVGIFFDLRDQFAGAGQARELFDVARDLRAQYGPAKAVLARGVLSCDAAIVPDVLDLRVPGTPLPHLAFARAQRPAALVYS